MGTSTWICDECLTEFSDTNSFIDCPEGHSFCDMCVIKLNIDVSVRNEEFSITEDKCPLCLIGETYYEYKKKINNSV